MIDSAGTGAAYGTAKAGVGVAALGVAHPHLVMKSIIPVVMAGVLGIYGLIVAVVISSKSVSLAIADPLHFLLTLSLPPTYRYSPSIDAQ